jgi:hypothetical protein
MRIQKNNYSALTTIFLFCASLEGATKSLKFFPCGALAEKKKYKIYVFPNARHTKNYGAHTTFGTTLLGIIKLWVFIGQLWTRPFCDVLSSNILNSVIPSEVRAEDRCLR